MASFGAVAMLAGIPIDVIQAPRWIVALDVLGSLAFAAVVILNRGGHPTAARLGVLVIANLLVLVNSAGLGVDSGVSMFCIALAGFPFVLFDLRERGAVSFGVAMSVAVFAVANTGVLGPLGGVPAGYSPRSYQLYSAVWSLAAAIFGFYQVSRANTRAEQALRDDIAARERAEREAAQSRQTAITAAKLAALGEMSANVAHEINNPLTAILLRARRLETLAGKQRLEKDAVVRSVQQIGSIVERIRRIIDALRAFARQGDADPMRPEPVRRIVDETVELCAQRFRMANVDLEVVHADEDGYIQCRGPQVSQVLLNLLSNAFDAVAGRPVRRVVMTVEAREQEMRIAVSDSGAGVAPEIADRIMEPFFTTKDVGHGTGLGLSLSKGIAEAHGGGLFLDAGAGETRFVLALPRCDPAASPEVPAEGARTSPP